MNLDLFVSLPADIKKYEIFSQLDSITRLFFRHAICPSFYPLPSKLTKSQHDELSSYSIYFMFKVIRMGLIDVNLIKDEIFEEIISEVGSNGEVEILEYINKQRDIRSSSKLVEIASRRGQIEVICWCLVEGRNDLRINISLAWRYSAIFGQLEIIKWMVGTFVYLRNQANLGHLFLLAGGNNCTNILTWLVKFCQEPN
jgi:hypothetical protein